MNYKNNTNNNIHNNTHNNTNNNTNIKITNIKKTIINVKKAMTLIELLVVIVVISILGVLSLKYVPKYIFQVKLSTATSKLTEIEFGINQLIKDTGQNPTKLTDLISPNSNNKETWKGPYISMNTAGTIGLVSLNGTITNDAKINLDNIFSIQNNLSPSLNPNLLIDTDSNKTLLKVTAFDSGKIPEIFIYINKYNGYKEESNGFDVTANIPTNNTGIAYIETTPPIKLSNDNILQKMYPICTTINSNICTNHDTEFYYSVYKKEKQDKVNNASLQPIPISKVSF